jgi:5-methylcytosine-specific restriction enzyme A
MHDLVTVTPMFFSDEEATDYFIASVASGLITVEQFFVLTILKVADRNKSTENLIEVACQAQSMTVEKFQLIKLQLFEQGFLLFDRHKKLILNFHKFGEFDYKDILKSAGVMCGNENLKRMDYADFLQTEYWNEIRYAINERDNRECQVCNSRSTADKSVQLHVHHKTYEHRGEEHLHSDDLILLCSDCHAKIHGKV